MGNGHYSCPQTVSSLDSECAEVDKGAPFSFRRGTGLIHPTVG